MRIIVLDYVNCHIVVVPVEKEYEEEAENNTLDCVDYLSARGFNLSEIHWALVEDCPVYWDQEVIPYFTL